MEKHYYVVFCAAEDQFKRFERRNKANNHCYILEQVKAGEVSGFVKTEMRISFLRTEFIPWQPLEDIINKTPKVYQVLELSAWKEEAEIDHLRLRRFTSSECVKHVLGLDAPKVNDPQELHDELLLKEYAVRVWRPRDPNLVDEERSSNLKKRDKLSSE